MSDIDQFCVEVRTSVFDMEEQSTRFPFSGNSRVYKLRFLHQSCNESESNVSSLLCRNEPNYRIDTSRNMRNDMHC